MKSSLKKMRGFVLHKHQHDAKDKRDFNPLAQIDELDQATQDMEDMRNCYDNLFSAAAATANCAYEFSVSLREMGACLLEKTSLNDDEESGRVLLMLGKVQYELQKLVDGYRSHITKTITTPSESLLNELRTVEVMKRQCDEKKTVYDYMIAAQKEKGKSRGTKGETFSPQQLQTAHDEYDEEATLFVFRLKSLKQGQSRSLVTQAARHHAAQLNLFRKGLKSLEAVESHVKLVAEHQHIDYQFSGLEDDDDDDDDGEDVYDDEGYDVNDDGELSFDYGQDEHLQDVSTSRNSMELDQVDLPTLESAQDNVGDLYTYNREPRPGSQSAPIFAEKKFDPAERIKQMRPVSTRKFHTYVLPTPVDTKPPIPSSLSNPVSRARDTSLSSHNIWHSSPLDRKGQGKDLKVLSVLKESNANTASIRLPPPLGDGLSLHNADSKKIKRHAFSGPLTSKPWSTKIATSASGPIPSFEHPRKVSPCPSPPLISSPKISELHELPRPPVHLTRPAGLVGHSAPGLVGHSAPLARRSHEVSAKVPSPLPVPPLAIARSFSIPSSSQRGKVLHQSPLREDENVNSPPLTPISLANITQPSQYKGE